MTQIVNRGTPDLAIKKQVRVHVSCPNCDSTLDLDADEVDIGHIVKCEGCGKNTYYPFERPWYRRSKLIVGYIVSLVVAFVIGLAAHYAYDRWNMGVSAAPVQSPKKD